ncbi:MAG TPA: MFS transporter [Geminicoccaceae bacterium]|nr:MFS transporter [Geminicoccaceae bacterium]
MLRVLTVAGALLVIAQLHRASGGVVSIELHHTFGLGAAEIGLVIGAMMLASAMVQVPAGLAFDRFGTRRTVSAMAVVALLGTLLFAAAGGFIGLALARFLIGVGFAGAVTSIMLLAMHWAPPERFATVAATVLAGASFAGGLLATTPMALALQNFGWAPTYLIVALLCTLAIGLVYAVIRDSPSGATVRSAGRENLADSFKGLRAMLGDADLRRIFAMAACTIAPFMCVGGLWAGPYLQDVHGLGRDQASYVLLGMMVMLNLGTLGYGPLDRWFGTCRGVVLAGAGASLVILATLALLPQPPLWLAVLLFLCLGLASPFYVTLTAHGRSFVPLERAGRLVATINLSALSIAFGAQWLSGLLVGLTGDGAALGSALGYRLMFGFLAAMLLVAFLLYYAVPERPTTIGARATPDGSARRARPTSCRPETASSACGRAASGARSAELKPGAGP